MEGEQAAPPTSGGSQPQIAEGDTNAPRQFPSLMPGPYLPSAYQHCGGVKATGAPRLPKNPSADFMDTPSEVEAPQASISPSQSPLPAHLIEGSGPGAGRRGPGRRSQRLPAGAVYMLARGRAGRVYAGRRGSGMVVNEGASHRR